MSAVQVDRGGWEELYREPQVPSCGPDRRDCDGRVLDPGRGPQFPRLATYPENWSTYRASLSSQKSRSAPFRPELRTASRKLIWAEGVLPRGAK